jgi:hypothetical protein
LATALLKFNYAIKFIDQEMKNFYKKIKMPHLSTNATKPTFEQKPKTKNQLKKPLN